MKRREFITFAGGAAVLPVVGRAQQSPIKVIGFLGSGSFENTQRLRAAFREGLEKRGYLEGRDYSFLFRWADGHYDRLDGLAADLVERKVSMIVAAVARPTAAAAIAATKSIPIVFLVGADPVATGLVASLNHPGGNATGITSLAAEIAPKRLALLHELVPTADRVAVIANSTNISPFNEALAPGGSFTKSASSLGIKLAVLNASTSAEIEAAFSTIVQSGIGACFIAQDAFYLNQSSQFSALAARAKIPACMELREFTTSGGLMSYGPDLANFWRLGGEYAARILRGEKPSELPVEQSSKFEFVINRKAAITLGIEISPQLLAIADEVIE